MSEFFRVAFGWAEVISKGIAPVALGVLLVPTVSSPARADIQDSPKAVIDEVWQIVNNEYVDGNFNQVDWQKTRQELLSREYSDSQEAYRAIRQALKNLGDPYTRFLTPAQFKDLTSKTSGELTGVGLRLAIERHSSILTVVESLENSPATKAGIKAGDKITRINGKPTALMTLEQATSAIEGEVGTDVSLEVNRQGQGVFEVVLTRAQIEVPSVAFQLKQEGPLKVGYIKLDEFSSHATEQMQKAIAQLTQQQAQGFVLDLRGNPGGLLFASIDIARLFMPAGTIVRTVDREVHDQKYWANNTAQTKLPLIVLIDEDSASASEILAAALQENDRALLVGTQTFGKGTVQSVHSLSDGSGLAVTVARYYPPSGTDINKRGVAPNVQVALTPQQQFRLQTDNTQRGTFSGDPQYARAVALLNNAITPKTTGEAAQLR